MTRAAPSPALRGVLRPPPLVAAIGFTKLGLLLGCASAYGFYRDELYALASARHLAWGSVVHPPLSIALLLGVVKLYGETIVSVRFVPALVGTFVIILTARLARRFGAGLFGQGLAALAVLATPELLAIDHVYSTRSFDVLFVTVIAGLVARALDAPKKEATRAWVGVGILAGLALENDLLVAVYLPAFALGVLAVEVANWRRTKTIQLTPLFAVGIAAVLFAPYLAWEAKHAFPTWGVVRRAIQEGRSAANPLRFALWQWFQLLPTTALLWGPGLVALLRGPKLAAYRPLGVAAVLTAVVLAALAAPDTWALAPFLPVLVAAGAASLDAWLTARRWGYPVFAVALLVPGALCLPLALPLLTVAKYETYRERLHLKRGDPAGLAPIVLPPHFAGMYGWPELVRSVDTVVSSLPPEDREQAIILANDDAQASAIDLFGPAVNLPPVISGHDDFWYWGTLGASGEVVVTVGGDEAFLRAHFARVDLVTVFGHSLASPTERRVRIYLCRGPVQPLDAMWPDFKASE